jgi:oligosaccharide reducing-end xylanase
MNRKININSSINWILTVLAVFFLLPAANVFGQKKNKAGNNKAAFHTGKYRNLFAEAGYSQDDIDKKIILRCI